MSASASAIVSLFLCPSLSTTLSSLLSLSVSLCLVRESRRVPFVIELTTKVSQKGHVLPHLVSLYCAAG